MVGDLNEDEWFYQCPTKIEGSIFQNKKGTCPESLQYRTRAKIRADNDFKLDISRKDAEQGVLQALTRFHQREIDHYRMEIKKSKGWFPYDRRRSRIADRRSQKVLRSSAIIWKHTSAIVCEPCSIFCDRLRSSAIICDRLRSCDHMETKVLRSAIEMYPIIFLILTDDSMFLSHKARMFDYSNAHLL